MSILRGYQTEKDMPHLAATRLSCAIVKITKSVRTMKTIRPQRKLISKEGTPFEVSPRAGEPKTPPFFKMVFLSVLGLTFLCLLISVYVSIHIDSGAKRGCNEKFE